ncbi:imidazole glycerol phosphate synthase subunit HisH [Patescibacteria group bacterium]|nr:imidazole glycerol phosphate synthase subunit HisH [Patescibacteria group bacterium]
MIAIIKYNAGNTASVANALEKFGYNYEITDDIEKILKADKVIFPGQGRAKPAMKDLKAKGLDEIIKQIKQPFLGICLGMQLLLPYSQEDNTKCFKIIEGEVRRFSNDQKIPQIGWNNLKQTQKNPLFDGIKDKSYVYFVNSYYVKTDNKNILARYKYGNTSAAGIIQKDNFYGTQFHPEKSGKVGLKILENFLKL